MKPSEAQRHRCPVCDEWCYCDISDLNYPPTSADCSHPCVSYDEDDGLEYCHKCHNRGIIVTCIDDMCRGANEYMHGDGEIICDCGASPW